MSIRNYDSTQTNHRKILSSPSVRKSNLKIINFFGREILNCGSGRKKLSKTHRPKTGFAAPWELKSHSRATAMPTAWALKIIMINMFYRFSDRVSHEIDFTAYRLWYSKRPLASVRVNVLKNKFWIEFKLDETDREKVEVYGNTMISSIQLRCRRVGTESSIQLVFQFTFLGKFIY